MSAEREAKAVACVVAGLMLACVVYLAAVASL